MTAALTPLQALVALHAQCELSLDFRPSLRRAMAEAYTAIVNAPMAPELTLPYAQTIELGSLETSEAEARTPRAEFLPLGDDFPEPHATPSVCACFAGMCRCEVVNGRTATGQHCRAQLQDTLEATS